MIDLSCGPSGRRNLTEGVQADLFYWHRHMSTWNGRARWRAHTNTPFVFGSDASTSGFAFVLESAPPAQLPRLPSGFRIGEARVGVWSNANGDAARQSKSAAIQYGEAFCLLASVVNFGSLLQDSHIVFLCDNESDVYAFNRNSSRDPRVCQLLRGVAAQACRYNFSFRAVHRPGVENDAMDWASRPARHRFTSSTADYVHTPAPAPSPTARARAHSLAFPPLTHLHSLVFVTSRCLTFGREGITASWSSPCGGW